MTAQRTSHDFEQDVLQGRTLAEAKADAANLAARANALTAYLSRSHAGVTAIVRANLETERNGLEMAAANLEGRIAEYTGQVEKVREAGSVPTARAAMLASRQRTAS